MGGQDCGSLRMRLVSDKGLPSVVRSWGVRREKGIGPKKPWGGTRGEGFCS